LGDGRRLMALVGSFSTGNYARGPLPAHGYRRVGDRRAGADRQDAELAVLAIIAWVRATTDATR
jgi:hypothetical protein